MMKKLLFVPLVMLLAVAQSLSAADTVDIRRGVPEDVFLVVHGKHNPERDFQQKYYEEVWKTVQETQIIDRIVKIVTSRMKDEDLEQAKAVIDELREAVEPIDLKGLAAAQEIVYAQQMIMAPHADLPASGHCPPDAGSGQVDRGRDHESVRVGGEVYRRAAAGRRIGGGRGEDLHAGLAGAVAVPAERGAARRDLCVLHVPGDCWKRASRC